VVLPTYEEAENLPGVAAAILEILPAATLLVVDDSCPDGTGELADRLARRRQPPRGVRWARRSAGGGRAPSPRPAPGRQGRPRPRLPRRVPGRPRRRRDLADPDGRRLVPRYRGAAVAPGADPRRSRGPVHRQPLRPRRQGPGL